jgi:hypothetical protein
VDEKLPSCGYFSNGSDGTRTRDLRRDRPTQTLSGAARCRCPRWLGVDERGREVLTWIDGETFTDRSRMHPYIGDPLHRVTFSDDQIGAAMRLLRRYHDVFGEDVICHGEFGPWNLVWRERLPIAIIDFDSVSRGEPADDVAYALRMFVSYGRPSRWNSFDAPRWHWPLTAAVSTLP